MQRRLSADYVDRPNRFLLESDEHYSEIGKRHILHSWQEPIKTEVTGPIASDSGIELYVVGAGSHVCIYLSPSSSGRRDG